MNMSFDPDAYQLDKLIPLLKTDLDLVSAIEQRLVVTNSPLDAERLRMDEAYVQTQYNRHLAEYDKIQTRIGTRALPQAQQADALTQEINAKLSVLLASVDDTRNAILSQIDSSERAVVSGVVGQLSKEYAQQTLGFCCRLWSVCPCLRRNSSKR